MKLKSLKSLSPLPVLNTNQPPFTSRSRRGSVKTGCLIAAGVVLVLLVAVGIWVAVSWKGWIGSATRATTIKILDQSELPADQKQKVITKINEVTTDFESGKIDGAQLGKIAQEIAQSPLLPLAVVYGIEEKHIKPSALPKEEKAAGVLNLQRAARGIVEKSISGSAIRDIIAPVTIQGPNNQIQMKEVVSDEELRQLFKNAKTRADDAKVPNEAYKINVGDELAKAIDTALGRIPKAAPSTNGSPAPTPPAAPPADKK